MLRSAKTAENQPDTRNRKTNRHRWPTLLLILWIDSYAYYFILQKLQTLNTSYERGFYAITSGHGPCFLYSCRVLEYVSAGIGRDFILQAWLKVQQCPFFNIPCRQNPSLLIRTYYSCAVFDILPRRYSNSAQCIGCAGAKSFAQSSSGISRRS